MPLNVNVVNNQTLINFIWKQIVENKALLVIIQYYEV